MKYTCLALLWGIGVLGTVPGVFNENERKKVKVGHIFHFSRLYFYVLVALKQRLHDLTIKGCNVISNNKQSNFYRAALYARDLSYGKAVCPSHSCFLIKRTKVLPTFLHHMKGNFI